ncbi:thiamin pyrophosphokinase 1 [Echinococcus multilocularis]|uniref:Thiamin pyrophosphokinase 1 n=1 Tax=Echinococcus multilocularis TaxID=6211 RepID=A0A068Y7G4_ECHMU|nr:thiamin pyrophosphokinase 1 [Echinococcus multilocularis]
MRAEPFSIVDRATKIGLICLNSRFNGLENLFKVLFCRASISVFVDGFANIIYDGPLRDSHTPNFVSGDFDSIRPEVKSFYEKQKTTKVIETPDQDASDFTKAIAVLLENIGGHCKESSTDRSLRKPDIDYIVGLYGSGGRADHEFGIVNSLFIAKGLTNIPLLLVTESSISCLLDEGFNEIHLSNCPTNLHCGLIPIGRPVRVTSKGLRWNLVSDNDILDFGKLVSTSNQTIDTRVEVVSDGLLLWSMSNCLTEML